MAAEFKLEVQSKKSGKCSKCRKPFEPTENVLGSAALYSAEEELYGSTYWRHIACSEKSQILWVGEKYSKIKGWDGLQSDEQESIKEQWKDVVNSEAKKKKAKGSGKGKQKKRKAKKGDDDEEEENDDDDDDKPKKKKKGKKEKKEKDPKAPKKPKTSFFQFSDANRADFKKEHPTAKPKEIVKMLGDAWKALSESEKKEWTDLYQKDKERYERQLKEYEKTGTFTPEPGEEAKSAGDEPKKPKKKLRKIGGDADGEESSEKTEEAESEKDKEQEQGEEGTTEKTNGEEASTD